MRRLAKAIAAFAAAYAEGRAKTMEYPFSHIRDRARQCREQRGRRNVITGEPFLPDSYYVIDRNNDVWLCNRPTGNRRPADAESIDFYSDWIVEEQ